VSHSGTGSARARISNKHNFSGGPGALPETVLNEARDAILEIPSVGLSVLGISHRSAWFRDVVDEAEENFRRLLALPRGYRVLFLQGGGTLQFSMIPMALLRGQAEAADYLVSGYWSGKSVPDARLEGPVRIVWDGEPFGFTRLPGKEELTFNPEAPYLHYASNETVEGLQFHRLLGLDGVKRICDMSSDFLSRPVDVSPFTLIYAHAQKNLGPAGVTVVVLREELLEELPKNLPSMLDYRVHHEHRSIYNTPPVFAIYVTLLVTRWLRDKVGGLSAMAAINYAKAEALYRTIDSSKGYYVGRAAQRDRSLMNVAFNISEREFETLFVQEAEAAGFHGLEGHRAIGGLRASLYNAVTLDAVHDLCRFMEAFRSRHA
jgi:phosphoserine aminotransferase